MRTGQFSRQRKVMPALLLVVGSFVAVIVSVVALQFNRFDTRQQAYFVDFGIGDNKSNEAAPPQDSSGISGGGSGGGTSLPAGLECFNYKDISSCKAQGVRCSWNDASRECYQSSTCNTEHQQQGKQQCEENGSGCVWNSAQNRCQPGSVLDCTLCQNGIDRNGNPLPPQAIGTVVASVGGCFQCTKVAVDACFYVKVDAGACGLTDADFPQPSNQMVNNPIPAENQGSLLNIGFSLCTQCVDGVDQFGNTGVVRYVGEGMIGENNACYACVRENGRCGYKYDAQGVACAGGSGGSGGSQTNPGTQSAGGNSLLDQLNSTILLLIGLPN
jgi:hypothetical protein